jgi:hypothetical protein
LSCGILSILNCEQQKHFLTQVSEDSGGAGKTEDRKLGRSEEPKRRFISPDVSDLWFLPGLSYLQLFRSSVFPAVAVPISYEP